MAVPLSTSTLSPLATPAPDVVAVILDRVMGVVSLDHLG